MISLYTWSTPNGRKVPILLEELGAPYEVHPVDISKQEQFSPAFLALSPNNKIPAIVDRSAPDGPLTLFESGAILTYLAEKHGRFLAQDGAQRYRTLAWLHWQVGGLAPMVGQLGQFTRAEEKSAFAIEHFRKEVARLLGVLERRLAESPYLAGDVYSIADIAAYPWAMVATTRLGELLEDSLANKPALHDWLERIGNRPAVARGMRVPGG